MKHGEIKHAGLTEEHFTFLVKLTELAHLLIHVDQEPFLIIERHGNEVGLKHPGVFITHLLVDTLRLHIDGDILHGIDDIPGLPVFLFHDGGPFQMPPVRGFLTANVKAAVEVSVLLLTRHQRVGMLLEVLLDGRV